MNRRCEGLKRAIVDLSVKVRGRAEIIQLSAIAAYGTTTLLTILRTLVVVRLLGAHNYGLVGLVSAVGNVFAVLQHLGLGVAAAKEVAQASGTQQLGLVTTVVLGVRFALLLPLLVLLVLVGAPLVASAYHLPELGLLIRLYALYLLVGAPGDILGYVLTGLEQYRIYFTLRILNEVVTTVVMITVVMVLGVQGYFIGYAIAGFVYTLSSGTAVWRLIGHRLFWPSREAVWDLVGSVFRTSLSVYLVKLLRGVSTQVPLMISGLFLSMTAVGWFKFALQIGGYLGSLLSPVQLVTLPHMTRLYTAQGMDCLLRQFASNFRRVAGGVGLLLVPALVLSPEIVKLLGGAEFANAGRISQLMVIYYAIIVLADNIFSGIHFPLSEERLYVFANALLFGASVLGVAIFVPWMQNVEAVGLSLLLGAGILLGTAIWQTRKLRVLPLTLMRSAGAVGIVAVSGLLSMLVEPLAWRLLICAVCLCLVAGDMLRSQPALQRLLR